MNNEKNENSLYSLIPIEEFKSILGIDDRDDRLVRFCLVTSTLSIEQFCKRRLLRKKYFELIEYTGGLFLPLKEYPVTNILAAFVIENGECGVESGKILEPEFYRVMPDCGTDIDLPFFIELSPSISRLRCKAIKVIYWAGYSKESVPADLSAACLELAAWNMRRYKGQRVGMTGYIRGTGKEGEHFEMSMPENVRALLEPYRRKTI